MSRLKHKLIFPKKETNVVLSFNDRNMLDFFSNLVNKKLISVDIDSGILQAETIITFEDYESPDK